MPNAPTSGGSVEGDQHFPSVKDFAEYILKFGIAGKQAPTGNLWINGANLGAYEYYYSASSLSITTMETSGVNTYSSTDRSKCFFLVVNGDISLSPGLYFYTGSLNADIVGKKLTCIYANGNISNGSLVSGGGIAGFYFHGSNSTDQPAEDITIISSPAGAYYYPRIAKTGDATYAQAQYIVSSAYSSTEGTQPPSKRSPSADGKMFFGNGGSGMSASENSVGGIGSAGFRATAWGGGGGGGGSYSVIHTYQNSGVGVAGSHGESAENPNGKVGTTITVTGGGGMPQGNSLDISPTRIYGYSLVSRVGGSGIVFARGAIANIYFSATGGRAPDNNNYNNAPQFVGSGGSGGGLIFYMAQSVVSSNANTDPGSGSTVNSILSGGNGAQGAVIGFEEAYF
jgi:hypothetical protein